MNGTNGGYGIGRPRFTPNDITDILTRWDNGEKVADLAREYGCNKAAIAYHLRRTLRLVPGKDRDEHDNHCARCKRPTYRHTNDPRPEGAKKAGGHGMCSTCYQRDLRSGRLAPTPAREEDRPCHRCGVLTPDGLCIDCVDVLRDDPIGASAFGAAS